MPAVGSRVVAEARARSTIATSAMVAMVAMVGALATLCNTAGCSRPRGRASTRSEIDAPRATDGRVPLVVTWEAQGEPRAGETFVVTARLARRGNFDQVLHVSVRVPDGARVVRGSTALDLPPTAAPRVDSIELALALATIPAGNLVLVADATGVGWGVHSEVPYRFGRSAPSVAGPAAQGPHVVIGGVDLGPAVPAGRTRSPEANRDSGSGDAPAVRDAM